jgi:hypothetical protein
MNTCNPSFLAGGGRKIVVQGWPRQKWEILSEDKLKAKGLDVWLK